MTCLLLTSAWHKEILNKQSISEILNKQVNEWIAVLISMPVTMVPIKKNTINSGSPANKRSNSHRKKIFPNMIMFGLVCYYRSNCFAIMVCTAPNKLQCLKMRYQSTPQLWWLILRVNLAGPWCPDM